MRLPDRRRRDRGRRRVELAVDSPDRPEAPPTSGVQPLLATLLGGAGVAVAGFLLSLAAAALAWLKAPDAVFSNLSRAATSVWLLAHGASATIGGLPLGIMPLGLTSLVALLAGGASGYAATQRRTALRARHEGVVPRPAVEALRTAGLFTLAYLVAMLVLGSAWGSGGQAFRALPGAVLVVGLSSLAGAMRALGWRPWRTWPVWARALPAATASALLTLLAGSGLVTGIALAEHWHRVSALQTALHPGAGGGFVLFLLQLAYLPNLVLWGGSWMLGAGFALGRGTMVTPVSTQLGFLPAVPVFGAVPSAGAHSQAHLLWLGVGVLAGALAALTVSLSRRRARLDEVALVGGLAGVVCALLFVLLAWLSGGPLGTQRLAVVGPRLWPLAVLGSTVLGLSGLLTGAVIGVLRPPHPDAGTDAADAGRHRGGRLRSGGAHRYRPDADEQNAPQAAGAGESEGSTDWTGPEPDPLEPDGHDRDIRERDVEDARDAHATHPVLASDHAPTNDAAIYEQPFDRKPWQPGTPGARVHDDRTAGRDDLLDGPDEATNPSIGRGRGASTTGSLRDGADADTDRTEDADDEPTRDIGRRARRAPRTGPDSR